MRKLCLLLALPLCGQTVIRHIPVTGQSLAQGSGGNPGLTAASPPAEAAWPAGVKNYYAGQGGTWGIFLAGTYERPELAMLNMLTEFSPGKAQLHSTYNEAVSGQPYSVLKKGAAGCPSCSYDYVLRDANNAKAYAAATGWALSIPAVVAVHGETDFQNHVSGSDYAAYMAEWQRDFESDLKPVSGQSAGVPLFVSQIATWNYFGHATPTTDTGGAGVPLGQWSAARDNPGKVYLVGPKYQFAYSSEGLHLINTSYRALGSLYAKAIKRVIADGQPWLPLSPKTITRSGAVITVKCHVPAGALARDTAMVPAQANEGFEFRDDSGMPPAIAQVQITASDTIQITLAGVPAGANQRLRYAYTGTAGAKAGTNNGQNYARGNIRDTDTAVDLWGNPLYDWMITFDEPVTADSTGQRTRAQGRVRIAGGAMR